MTVKRRNHGRNKHGRGHVNRVRCVSTAKAIPKDKAIKRFIVRNLVDASALRDIRDASAFENYQLPKLYVKQYYCVEAAVHQRIVRVRSAEGRKYREAPSRMKHGEGRMRCSNCCYKTNGIPPLHHDQMNEKGQRLTGKSCHGVFY